MAESIYGWRAKRRGKSIVYEGVFRCQDGTKVIGRIVENKWWPADVYIWDPPMPLRTNHKNGACWQLVRPGELWFRLHWEKPPWDFEPCLLYVEQLLRDSIQAESQLCSPERSGSSMDTLIYLGLVCVAVLVVVALLLLLSNMMGI